MRIMITITDLGLQYGGSVLFSHADVLTGFPV